MDYYDELIELNGYCRKDNPNEYIECGEHEKIYLAKRYQDEWVIHVEVGVVSKVIENEEILEIYKK